MAWRMIQSLGAAFLFLSLSGSLAFAQTVDGSENDKAIRPAAKTGVYRDLNKLEGKMQQTRTDKDRVRGGVDQINSALKGKH